LPDGKHSWLVQAWAVCLLKKRDPENIAKPHGLSYTRFKNE
jgi:hypothetical protein